MLLKICGITSFEDAEMILNEGNEKKIPHYLGFVFFEKSPRYIPAENAKNIVENIHEKYGKSRVQFVGVFVNTNLAHENILKTYSFLDVFQLHGDNTIETPEFCKEVKEKNAHQKIWKAFRVNEQSDLQYIQNYSCVDAVLIDAFSEVKNEYGGSGKHVNKNILPYIRSFIGSHQQFFIAGGITTENKDEILALSQADGIDLSSSMEEFAGKKSKEKIEKMVKSFDFLGKKSETR